jgi:hypothetical protein
VLFLAGAGGAWILPDLCMSSKLLCTLAAPGVTCSGSRALSFPGPADVPGCGAWIGEHQGVHGGGGNAHRRAAFLGARPWWGQRLSRLANVLLRAVLEPGQIGQSPVPLDRGARGPQR